MSSQADKSIAEFGTIDVDRHCVVNDGSEAG